jgi:hypothetical protein
MKAAVEEKIDLLGDDYDFERRDSTTQIYAVNAEDVKMEIQPYNSTLERAMGGTENIDDYKAWIKAGADVLKDDRVAISGVYCLVTSLKDWGTHSVITLYQTGTASD